MDQTEAEPIDHLRVGDAWGVGLGGKLVRVHRVDPTGGRAQFRMAERPGKGKRWVVDRVLKPGASVTLRRMFLNGGEGAYSVELSAVVLSSQQNGVTLGGFEVAPEREVVS